MKIPGKLPIQTITKKLSTSDKEIVSNAVLSDKNVVSLNTKEILYKKSNQSFSVKLLNYVEPYLIKGQRYTLFYTDVDHNLKLNDRVFITGGNYDSDLLIQRNKFNKLSDGYTVLYIDRTKVVLDIEYTGTLPWTDEPIDNFVKVYVANSQEDFDYYIRTTSTRDYDYVTNRFSNYGPFSNNNLLYINGTFSIGSNSYDILGFTNSGISYLTYSNSFLVLDGFNSGYLKDVTSDVLSNNLPISYGDKRLFISSGPFYVSIGGGFRRLFITFDEAHGFTSSVSLKLWKLSGSGNISFWNNSTFTFSFNTNFTLTTDVFDPINLYNVTILDGIATSISDQINFNNNQSLFIMNSDFEKSGVDFKKGYPFYYDNDESTWKVDRQYIQPIITEQNFRNGVFKKGEFNQGLFGTHQETIDYEGLSVKFSLGTVLNTIWHNGDIGSGVGSNKSYFTQFDEFGLPSIRENESNNAGIGYNYVYDSTIYKSIVSNGTYNNTNFGTISNDLVVYKNLTGSTFSYEVYLNSGNYFNSQIDSTYIKNSSVFSSLVRNSNFELSKSVNSEFEKTLFLSSKYTSDKIVKILDYDERSIILPDDLGNDMNCKLYKFYITEDSFERLRDFQSFYFDNLKLNIPNTKVLNQFDDKFTIDSYDFSYDEITGKMTKKILVQLSTAAENLKTISGLSNQLIDNIKTSYPSIDIILSNGQDFDNSRTTIATGSYYFDITPLTLMPSWNGTYSNIGTLQTSGGVFTFSNATSSQSLYTNLQSTIGTWTYSGTTFSVSGTPTFESISLIDENGEFEEVFSFRLSFYDDIVSNGKIIDVTDAYIIDSDFKSGLFKNSNWVTGNYINYNKDYSFDTLPVSEYYQNSSLDSSSNSLSLIIKEKLRRDLISQGDIAFINALYYDTTLNSGDNLVKLPDTYQVNSIFVSSQRTFELFDFVNGTNSSIYNSPSFNISSYLKTPDAENAYNYLHPVKFENSNIQSGIFRRAYFKGCNINNNLFNNSDKNPTNYNNWRSLLLSDVIFNDNSNVINSGLLINSHFTSGSDVWENGIVYNSIWNVDSYTWSNSATGSVIQTSISKFKDGIFRDSRWVNGIFENGDFYRNRSNVVFTTDVFSDITDAYYRNKNNDTIPQGKTRYAWLDGTFENGQFELSTFENGTFKDGDFFNSNFINGEVLSGNFGRRNIKFPLTRISGGSFSNVNVVSAEFRSENPTGQVEGNYQIDWYSGIFNNGIFGVRVDSTSYSVSGPNYSFKSIWHNGTFNNGSFTDTAVWKSGEFNNGKFISYFGYPFVTAASYSSAGSSSFAWQDGEFNGGEFGNGVSGTNSTWFNGEFNGGIFKGRYWNNGILTRGVFIGSGTSSTQLSNIPIFTSDFSDEFFGLWNNGIVNNVKDTFVKNKKIFTKPEREISKKVKRATAEIRNALWRTGTFSHSDGLFNNSVWLGGVFEKGRFFKSSFNPYLNYLVNGDFRLSNVSEPLYWDNSYSDIDGLIPIGGEIIVADTNNYSSDPNKKLLFVGTSSIANLSQTSGLIIGETYTFRLIVENNYNNEIRFGDWTTNLVNRNFNQGYENWIIAATSQTGGTMPNLTIATGSPGYLDFSDTTTDGQFYMIYPGILTPGRDYIVKFYTFDESNMDIPYIGSCDTSQVTINDFVLETSFVDGVSITYSVPNPSGTSFRTYNGIITADYTDFYISFTTNTSNSSVKVQNIIVSGNTGLLSSDVTSKTSYSYQFNAQGSNFAIELIPKAEATSTGVSWSVATVSILNAEIVKGNSGFNTSDDCYWDNGTFEESEFYISKWNNGSWISGTAVGMIWKNGVANYMNAYNVYWEGGVWRNGNWNGSPFSYENVNENGCEFTYDSKSLSSLATPWNGLDLSPSPVGSLVRVDISNTLNNGFTISCTAFNSFTSTYRDLELDPENLSGFVYINGYPFVKFDATSTTVGESYKVTINIGTVSFANYEDADNCTIQFSIGRPGLNGYGEFSGTYEGSLYPSSSLLANSEDYVSNQYFLKNLNGHNGSIIPDLLLSGVDGYQSIDGGTITEIIKSRDDRNLYLHLNLYGVSDFYVNSITIEEENCNPRIVINEGYASDILTNVALYRDSVSDNYYQEVFINNAFTASEDLNWPKINGQPDLTILSFTQAGTPASHRWNFLSTIPKYSQVNCSSGFSTIAFLANPIETNTNFSTSYKYSSNYLIAQNTNLSTDLFTQSGEYQIEIKYEFIVGPTATSNVSADGWVEFSIGYDSSISVDSDTSSNGGFIDIKKHAIRLLPLGCGGGQKVGKYSGVYTTTFNPTGFTEPGQAVNSKKLRIRKLKSSNNSTAIEGSVRLLIKEAKVINKSIAYDPIYNNATYSMFNSNPSYNDILLLPETTIIGPAANGNLITTRFGNGIFTSGTASSFSSIWENGVWNEGFRYDRYVIAFSNFERFNGTSKSFSYPGQFEQKSVKIGNIPSNLDNNLSTRKYSNTNWIIRLSRLNGFVQYENQIVDQLDKDLNYYFKIGDRVSVGNIYATDINSKRRLIKDYFKVVNINADIIELEITLNFPIRSIDKDSEDHLIYVSKNIWLNGAFLNGTFKGVWNNGLFKGRPYLTKMIDSQWIDGRFIGGHFKGLTLSLISNIENGDVESVYPSGLIQYFWFVDDNVGTYLSNSLKNYMRYNSWIDVNYFTSSMVNIYRNTISYDSGFKTERSLINLNGYPTKDILSSYSRFKNSFDDGFGKYNLGYKYEKYDDYIPNPYFNYPISSFEDFDIAGAFFDVTEPTIFVGLDNQVYSITPTSSLPGLYDFVKNNFWVPKVLNESQGLSYSANTNMDNIDLLKIVSTTQSGANLLQNLISKSFPKSRYSSIEFEMSISGTISGQFPYLLNEPEAKYFPDSDQVEFVSAVPTTIQHDKTNEAVKKEYFYNKGSLQMVLANVVRYFDSWAVPAWGVIVEPGHNIQAGDVVFISKRDKSSNLQIEGLHTVIGLTAAGANPPAPYTELLLIPEISNGYIPTPAGTDGGVLFVYRPYTAYFKSIQMTQLDAIPFFLYATQSRIVSDILAPYSAVAPPIDYSDSKFSLIDNISVTETIFEIVDNPVIQINSGGNQSGGRPINNFNDDLRLPSGTNTQGTNLPSQRFN